MGAALDVEALRAYVGDHLAGSRAGTEVAERCADGSEGELERYLRGFLEELAEEAATLRTTLDRLDTSPPLSRQAVTKAGAVVNVVREMLPGSYDDLHRLRDLEGLCVGVWGKRLLWSTLIKAAAADERLADLPYDELADQAERQERELLAWRDRAAAGAIGIGVTTAGS
ncbi:MAG TPA: hypothetical protein VLA82_14450 [Actinomycetota bacterium]|nr:hypothetical protein [Actinomycetota bacterium]